MKGISVVIACYQAGAYLKEAVDSVCQVRTALPFEVLVVDDASPDFETQETLSQIESQIEDAYQGRVRVFRQAENGGQSAARNVALSQAKYDYIFPLDADDKLDVRRPGYFDHAVSLLEKNPELFTVYSRTKFFGARSSAFLLPAYSEPDMLLNNMIPVHGIYRKEEAISVGGYQERLRYCEDWDFWLSLSSRRLVSGKERAAHELADPHYLYRQHRHGGNVSIAQRVPMSNLFSQMMERSSPLYEHHLGTDDPDRIAWIRKEEHTPLKRIFLRAANASFADLAHYAVDLVRYNMGLARYSAGQEDRGTLIPSRG